MDAIARELAAYLLEQLIDRPPSSRLLVGIAGAPASGKTTLAASIDLHLNTLQPGICATVSLDGWHYTRAYLSSMPNPVEAFERRGAEWTFDAESYCDFVTQLRRNTTTIIEAPSFSHSEKDPIQGAITILPTHRIVIIEGLYTFLQTERWKAAAEGLDERWFVDVDFEVAKTRLVRRHVLTGVTSTPEQALARAVGNDIPNGQFIVANMMEPTRRIPTTNDPTILE